MRDPIVLLLTFSLLSRTTMELVFCCCLIFSDSNSCTRDFAYRIASMAIKILMMMVQWVSKVQMQMT
ncbi:hypothetical protein Hdeb2414_s0005g00162181 [Helianthus debilis subsp. tardiflorus]